MQDVVFSALADPTRRAIVERLAHGEAMVTELCRDFPLTQPAISRHVRILEEAGLIRRRAEGTKRLCSLSPATLTTINDWLSELRRVLELNYSRLDQLLDSMQAPAPSLTEELKAELATAPTSTEPCEVKPNTKTPGENLDASQTLTRVRNRSRRGAEVQRTRRPRVPRPR